MRENTEISENHHPAKRNEAWTNIVPGPNGLTGTNYLGRRGVNFRNAPVRCFARCRPRKTAKTEDMTT